MSICKQHITDFSQSQRRSSRVTLHRRLFMIQTQLSSVQCSSSAWILLLITYDPAWNYYIMHCVYLFIIIIPLLTVYILLPWHLGLNMNWENLAKTFSSIWSDSYSSFVCFHFCGWKNEDHSTVLIPCFFSSFLGSSWSVWFSLRLLL